MHPAVVFLGSSPRYLGTYPALPSVSPRKPGRVACSWQLENKYLHVFQRLVRYKRRETTTTTETLLCTMGFSHTLGFSASSFHPFSGNLRSVIRAWPVIPADIERAKGITRGYTCARATWLFFFLNHSTSSRSYISHTPLLHDESLAVVPRSIWRFIALI